LDLELDPVYNHLTGCMCLGKNLVVFDDEELELVLREVRLLVRRHRLQQVPVSEGVEV